MAKFRSSQDFAATYNSNKRGFSIPTENFVHIKEETSAGVLTPPSIGTQGDSFSDASPSTDISGGSNANLRINGDGFGVVAVTLVKTGKTTGTLIAAELESKINAALEAAGSDSRVWVTFSGGVYIVRSQKTGTGSSVVITAGLSLDVTADLKLGVANGGDESVGEAGGDYLWMTKCSMKMSQPFEMSEHKSGRQATNIIKKKKQADGDIEMYFNLGSGGSPSMDTATMLLLESAIGKKTASGSAIDFDGSQANSKYFTIVQGNNAFGRYFNGGYAKSYKGTLPGEGEAKMNVAIKARDGLYAGIARLNGAVSASATATLENGESYNFDVGAPVMVVDPDGRTVLAGQDGSLTVLSRTDGSHQIGLSATVTVPDEGFIVPWLPHVFDQTGTDNPVTGLEGSVSFDGGSTTVEEVRSIEFGYDPQVTDLDDWYGSDTNKGFVVSDRAAVDVKIELVMSASQVRQIIRAKEFITSNIKLVLGDASGRHYRFTFPKVYFAVPALEIPDSGVVPLVLEGKAVQSTPGALDAFTMSAL